MIETLSASINGLIQVLNPLTIGLLFVGTVIGLIVGALPGVGGRNALAILLPYTFVLSPTAGISMMVGLVAAINTGDSITAILFGIPGSSGPSATIMDGYPMAKSGEAGRALGAAFMSSMIGGIFGAFVLGAAVPILRPLVLTFGVPEMFMLALLGITMVVVVSGNAVGKGFIAGGLGLLLGAVGTTPQSGIQRWTFGLPYLWEGVPLVAVFLGMWSIPEVMEFAIKGSGMAVDTGDPKSGMWEGCKDVFRNWWLVLRCSGIGTFVGFLPGLGATVSEWASYGHAVQSSKDHDRFGKGDVRGVIAPESANNAKTGGNLIPTLAFGVPGTASMALVFAGLIVHGVSPGPDMLTKHINFVFALVWAVAIANVFATVVCLFTTRQIAAIIRMPSYILVPLILVLIVVGSLEATNQWGDLIFMLAFAVLGWFMKLAKWPAMPAMLGLILGPIAENNLHLATSIYGINWVRRPIVLAILALILLNTIYGVRRTRLSKRRSSEHLVHKKN